jgi:integrase
MIKPPLSMNEAAVALNVSRRWLQDFLLTIPPCDRKVAAKFLADWRAEAQRDALSGHAKAPLTFAGAALGYMKSGRSPLFLAPLLEHFGETPLSEIGQEQIDTAAVALYPQAQPQTCNRCVYTPISAIMRHAGVVKAIRRPKWTGGKRLDWLRPEEAHKLLGAAGETDRRLGGLMTFLLYAGPRLSEALRLT